MRIDSINSQGIQNINQNLKADVNVGQKTLELEKANKQELERDRKYTEGEIKEALNDVNKALNPYDRKLEFSIHEETKIISVKVIDTNTEEVIREIPPEKILDMVAKLWELAGIIVDKKI